MQVIRQLESVRARGSVFAAFAFGAVAVLATTTASGQLPSPTLDSVFPPGAQSGDQVDVKISGKDLDGPARLLFSHPGITSQQKKTKPSEIYPDPRPIENEFTVKVAGNVPPGVYEARVVGRFGVSNPRAFRVGGQPPVLESGSNNRAEQAQEIKVGDSVYGQVAASNLDYFRFQAKRGQRLVIDCDAQRLDSRMDAALVLLDSAGNELARSRDYDRQDPLLAFQAPGDGEYIVGVYDFLYRGGDEYFYRLRVHDGPHIDFVFPPSGQPGSKARYKLYGRNLPGGKPANGMTLDGQPLEVIETEIALPADEASRSGMAVDSLVEPRSAALDRFIYRWTGSGASSNPVPIAFAAAPVIAEADNNDTPESAQKVTLPCEYVGRFYPARDRDWIEFQAKKGEVFWIEVLSHRLGLDSDPAIVVQRVTDDGKGKTQVSEVAAVDDPPRQNRSNQPNPFDTSTVDPTYRFAVTQDATYRIVLRDQFSQTQSDPRNVYRLLIRKAEPDFRVVAMPAGKTDPRNRNNVQMGSTVLRRGGAEVMTVKIFRRHGFTGDVEITADRLPAGVKCEGAIVGGNVDTASLVFTAAENAPAWAGPIQVIAKATVGGKQVTRRARPASIVVSPDQRSQAPPRARLTRDLVLAVIDSEKAQAAIAAGEGKVIDTAIGAKLELPVKVTRHDGFKAALKLKPVGLSNDFKAKEVNLAGSATEGKLQLELSNTRIPTGAMTFYLSGATKVKYARNPDAVKQVEADQKALAAANQKAAEQVKKATDARTAADRMMQQKANELRQAQQNKTNAENALKQADARLKQAEAKLAAAQAAAKKDAKNKGLADAAAAAEKELAQVKTQREEAAKKLADTQKALADAESQSKAAAQAKQKAENELKEAQAKQKMLADAKRKIDQELNNVKRANQPKDINIELISTPVKLRIRKAPLELKLPESVSVKQGAKGEAAVNVERLFGFNDTVTLSFAPPKGVGGISVKQLNLKKGENGGKLEITAAKDAPEGKHTFTVSARMRFNNVTVTDTREFVVSVAK